MQLPLSSILHEISQPLLSLFYLLLAKGLHVTKWKVTQFQNILWLCTIGSLEKKEELTQENNMLNRLI